MAGTRPPQSALSQLPAVHLIAQQPLPLPGTPRALTAMLLELASAGTGSSKVRLTASDGEVVEVVWASGEEIRALGSRLYLQVWRDASVYVLP